MSGRIYFFVFFCLLCYTVYCIDVDISIHIKQSSEQHDKSTPHHQLKHIQPLANSQQQQYLLQKPGTNIIADEAEFDTAAPSSTRPNRPKTGVQNKPVPDRAARIRAITRGRRVPRKPLYRPRSPVQVMKSRKYASSFSQSLHDLETRLGVRHRVIDIETGRTNPSRPTNRAREGEFDSALQSDDDQIDFAQVHSPPSSDRLSNPKFNYRDAIRYYTYCLATYSLDITKLSTWQCADFCSLPSAKGFEMIEVVSDYSTDSLGFVGANTEHSEIIIAFRGTQSLMNWIQDLQFWQTDTELNGITGATTASGFSQVFTALKNQIWQATLVAKLRYPNYTIKIVGHSLGGAVATICALDFAVNGGLKVEHHSFGSPRVGNSQFVQYFSRYVGKAIRMTHDSDPVPHMPMASIMGFQHINQEIWQVDKMPMPPNKFLTKAVFVECDILNGEDNDCSASETLWLLDMYISHHNYLNITRENKNLYNDNLISVGPKSLFAFGLDIKHNDWTYLGLAQEKSLEMLWSLGQMAFTTASYPLSYLWSYNTLF